MKLPRRAPRQVYRVYDEQEFLDEGAALESSPSEPHRLQIRPEVANPCREENNDPARGARRHFPLAPALLLVAMVAVGVVAFDVVSTLRRGRSRGVNQHPVSRPGATAGLDGARPVLHHRHHQAGRSGDPRAVRTTTHPGARSGRRAMRPVGVGHPPAGSAEPSTVPEPGEFSFEKRAAP